ncbi:hypothetical protein QBC47DRAFT_355367 [Echria macrotheca]|uniref:BZIP domain-containing protein n=1 Tax=Echria macrotheca TaxID=438768 RepID=A0AAJ0BL11_9PEZI|nr:hypothetical protein QBC47DRAFT_355367 [Echria macrotheca]
MPNEEESGKVELEHKRERGRLAQRAFRKRQIDTIRELREDNQALRAAIDRISRVYATGPVSQALHAELQTALEEAFRVAGLDPSLARSFSDSGEDGEDDDVMSVPSGYPAPGQLGAMLSQSGGNLSLGASVFSAPPVSNQLAMTTQALNPLYTQQAMTQPQMYSQLPFSTSSPPSPTLSSNGRMSPRMTYGLWFEPDRNIRIVQPPQDIIPYVGEGMRTLAGAIFWTGMGHSLNALRTILNARIRGVVIDPDAPSSDDESDDGGDGGFVGKDGDRSFSRDFSHLTLRPEPVDGGRLVVGGVDDEDEDEAEETLTETQKANLDGGQTQTRPRSNQKSSPRPHRDFPSQHHPTEPTTTHHRSRSQKERKYRRRLREAQRFIGARFAHTLRLIPDRSVYDILHARFVYRSKGWIAGDHPGRDPETPMRLFTAILRETAFASEIGDLASWMTPVDIDGYVQQWLALTPAGWAPWAAALRGGGTPQRVDMVNKLIQAIVMYGQCFGEGPRYRAEHVRRSTAQFRRITVYDYIV